MLVKLVHGRSVCFWISLGNWIDSMQGWLLLSTNYTYVFSCIYPTKQITNYGCMIKSWKRKFNRVV